MNRLSRLPDGNHGLGSGDLDADGVAVAVGVGDGVEVLGDSSGARDAKLVGSFRGDGDANAGLESRGLER